MNRKQKGFTLIELLVVIAIIAILAVVVVLTLNPSELLKQSRDSQRVSDISTIKSAIGLYLVDSASPNLASSSLGGYAACYVSTVTGKGTSTCGIFSKTYSSGLVSTTATAYRSNNAQGWLPVNFSQITYGSPLTSLPIDPVNNGTNYYAYAATTTGGYFFQINTFMESKKYNAGGTNNLVSTDGGPNNAVYEAGNDPGLGL